MIIVEQNSKVLNNAAYLYAAMNYNFSLKKEPNKQGLCPIYLNVRISTKRSRLPIDLRVKSEHWDRENQRVINCEESEDYNLILKQIESRITNIKVQHRLSEIPLTMEKFVEQLKTAPPSFDLVQYFEHVIDYQELSKSTIEKHKGIFSKLKESKISALFQDINLLWFDKYRTYLKKTGK